ncbi:MAG: zinc ribbon domain-containing protein [Eggerthellaceae bacterium]|nr:zinc ribbon domain-containing protein [Eggerthellaceae bacterium]
MQFNELKNSLGGVLDKGIGELNARITSATNNISEQHQTPESSTFCIQCGAPMPTNARFCPSCGASIPDVAQDAPLPHTSHQTTRQTAYSGIVSKCPNCGSTVGSTDAICAECGYQMAGKSASSTLQQFSLQMMEIEQSRNALGAIMGSVLGKSDEVDQRKALFIKTFPVPNTVEELSEFMYMATSNINVSLSKKGLFSTFKQSSGEKEISDAWVSKMQQIYRKAEMSFSSHPAFTQIKKLYRSKMTELNMNAGE